MDMIKTLLEIEVDSQDNALSIEQKTNHKLFVGGTIDSGFGESKKLKPLNTTNYVRSMKRQGQFLVILLNLKEAKGTSYQETEDKVRLNVKGLYNNFDYLLHSTQISDKEKQDFLNSIYISKVI